MLKRSGICFLIFSLFCFSELKAQWVKTKGPTGGVILCISASADGSTLFAGTGLSIFRSTDKGKSWVETSSGLPQSEIMAIEHCESYLFASCSGYGVYVSSNNGNTWNPAGSGLDSLYISSFLTDGSKIYAGTTAGMFVSSDFGASWKTINNGMGESFVISIAGSGKGLIAGTNKSVFFSADSGLSWKEIGAGLPRYPFHVASTGPYIFAGTDFNGIYRSSDNGASWIEIGKNYKIESLSQLNSSGADLFASTYHGIFMSTNFGDSWTKVNAGLGDSTVFAFYASDSNLYAGTYGGVYFSADYGKSWSESNSGLTNAEVKGLTYDGKLYAGTYGRIFVSRDNGENWKSLTGSMPFYGYNSIAMKDSIIFLGAEGGGIYLSKDQGSTWTPSTEGLTSNRLECIEVNGNDIYAGTEGGGAFFRSTDNGASWKAYNNGLYSFNRITSITFQVTDIFAGSYESGIYKSTDKGISWTHSDASMDAAFVYFLASDGTRLYAATSAGIYLSADSGASWQVTYKEPYMYKIIVNGSNILACGWNGVFLSKDKGVSWTDISSGLRGSAVFQIAVSAEYLFAGTSGDGVWRRSLKEMLTSVNGYSGTQVPSSYSLEQNFPNPFNPATTISYSIPKQSYVELKIYDIIGREITTLVSKEQSAGEYRVQFNASSLPSGVYLYKIHAGQFRDSKKLLLLK